MKITVTLSESDIDKAIDELIRYQRRLEEKNEVFVDKLMDTALPVVEEAMTAGETGSDDGEDSSREYRVDTPKEKSGARVTGTFTVFNQDIMFWEFGAGVYYNGSTVAGYASRFGYGPGTYPGQTHVPEPGYWFYERKKSYGTEATMPLYYSAQKMREMASTVAREVFGSGK